jgi:hypothetical protein
MYSSALGKAAVAASYSNYKAIVVLTKTPISRRTSNESSLVDMMKIQSNSFRIRKINGQVIAITAGGVGEQKF